MTPAVHFPYGFVLLPGFGLFLLFAPSPSRTGLQKSTSKPTALLHFGYADKPLVIVHLAVSEADKSVDLGFCPSNVALISHGPDLFSMFPEIIFWHSTQSATSNSIILDAGFHRSIGGIPSFHRWNSEFH